MDTTKSKNSQENEPDSKPAWAPGTILSGTYVIDSVLGEGGMGTVYLVRRIRDRYPFAIKTLLDKSLNNPYLKRDFLRELRTWIDLPDHPNLAVCRFFRTIEDRLVIFADYVSGGSLKNWIRMGRIESLAQVVDIAIQSSRGLHAAHECGVIHQDVKPANILMTNDGIAKITDFGLARAQKRLPGDLPVPDGLSNNSMVSSAGMTPGYASPEQFDCQPLTRQTDVWSWGLSVLEMLTGRAFWQYGIMAPEILGKCLQKDRMQMNLPIPEPVAKVLEKCFETSLLSRWKTLEEPAAVLCEYYEEICKTEYPRSVPKPSRKTSAILTDPDRKIAIGAAWLDPDPILRRAFELSGRDLDDFHRMIPQRTGSRKSDAIADLEVFEEIDRIYSELIAKDWPELKSELASILKEKSLVCYFLEDLDSAILHLDRAIDLTSARNRRDMESSEIKGLADMMLQKGVFLWQNGNTAESLPVYDDAITIVESMIEAKDSGSAKSQLGLLLLNKANSLVTLGRTQPAIELYDRCISIRENLNRENRLKFLHDLAIVYMNKAVALNTSARYQEALTCYDRARAYREEENAGTQSIASTYDLAFTYSNIMVTLLALNDFIRAVETGWKAAALFEDLVEQKGRQDLLNEYLRVRMNMAIALSNSNRTQEALLIMRKVISDRENLVNKSGQEILRNDLAKSYHSLAVILINLKEHKESAQWCNAAIDIWEHLAAQKDRIDSRLLLPKAYFTLSEIQYYLGLFDLAGESIQHAIDLADATLNDHILQLKYQTVIFIGWLAALKQSQGKMLEANNAYRNLLTYIERFNKQEISQNPLVPNKDVFRSDINLAEAAISTLRQFISDNGVLDLMDIVEFIEATAGITKDR